MSDIRATVQARQHLEEMVSLANTLISESMNQSNPIDPPIRTLSKEDFLSQYKMHSESLKELLMHLDPEPVEKVDASLQESRGTLIEVVSELQKKLDKLNNLCFWMDNMVSEQKEQSFNPSQIHN